MKEKKKAPSFEEILKALLKTKPPKDGDKKKSKKTRPK